MRRILRFAAPGILVALLALAGPASANPYTVTDLGTLPGGSGSDVAAINEAGQVTGTSQVLVNGELRNHAFLYSGAGMIDLGTLPGGTDSYAAAINNAGQVVGYSSTLVDGGLVDHAFLYSGGVMTDLGTLPGRSHSYANAINDAGQVAGNSWNPFDPNVDPFNEQLPERHTFLYSGGVMTDLGAPVGGYSYPTAMNEAGQVIGVSIQWWESDDPGMKFTQIPYGFVYSGGVMTGLSYPLSYPVAINDAGQVVVDGPGGTDEPGFLYSGGVITILSFAPTGINDAGQVIGSLRGGHASLYSGGTTTDLGMLPGGLGGEPRAINQSGQVVGRSDTLVDGSMQTHAFVYSAGVMTDLGTLPGGTYSDTRAINGAGQIAGFGDTLVNGNLEQHAFLASIANTPPGSDVTVQPSSSVGLTFDSVVTSGETTVTPTTASEEAPLPGNFQVSGALFYDVATTATFSGPIQLSFHYDASLFTSEQNVRLLHFENGAWQDVTTSVDTANHVVYGQTTSLSPFAVAQRAYSWSGVLQPVNANGSSVFKLGSTVPVKFQLTGSSAGITNLQARLYIAKVSNSVVATEVEAGSTSAATSGNLFRYDASSGQYVFNWSTKGLTLGTYQLRIDLGDGVAHTVLVGLK